MGKGFDRTAVGLDDTRDEGMIIAVNDISFLWGFDTPYHAAGLSADKSAV